MADSKLSVDNQDLQMLLRNKESGYNYRKRREEEWLENYMLYRGKVNVNRLTQRQTVHVPLMKNTIRTLLKDVDDLPVLYFSNLSNDKQKELYQNEYWKWTGEKNHFDLQDIVDKRQVFVFGRSFDQWQICKGYIKQTIIDPQDILVSRFVNPWDLNTSRFLIHQHIYTPLSEIEDNPDYDKNAVKRLKTFYMSEMGLIKAEDNLSMMEERNKKMEVLGVDDADAPMLGETYVELTIHFVFQDPEHKETEKDEDEEIFMYVEADNQEILMKKAQEEVIGTTKDHYWKDHYAYNTWGDDIEVQDFWSDGVADIVRPSNQILDINFSQLLENRTLQNLNMHYWDSGMEGFNPSVLNPVAWGWYGMPVPEGKTIDDVVKTVQVADLTGSLEEMNFVIGLNEKATGATATQQGAETARQTTLGEVQLVLSEAKERVKGMSKFYTPAWKHRGEIFLKLIEAGAEKLDIVQITKKGRNTDAMFSREIAPKDWMDKQGYTTKIWSQDEKNTDDTNNLQKVNAAKTIMPNNVKLADIYKRKVLEFAGMTPDEINDIMQEEQQQMAAMTAAASNPMQGAMDGSTGDQVPPPMPEPSLPTAAPIQA